MVPMSQKLLLGAAAVLALAVLGRPRKRQRESEPRERRPRRKEAQGVHGDGRPEDPTRGPKPTVAAPVPPAPQQASSTGVPRLLLSIVAAIAAIALHTFASWEAPLVWVALGSALFLLLLQLIRKGFASPQVAEEAVVQVQAQPLLPDEARERLHDFNGFWNKDKEASDSMEEACQLMRMNALLRTAVRLIKGIHVRQSEEEFEMSVLSGILWFKVTERYPLSGEERSWKRRDLRKGKHTASVHPQPDGSLQMRLAWPDPFGGMGVDTFYCPSPGTLWVTTSITVGGRTVRYRQVYRKA